MKQAAAHTTTSNSRGHSSTLVLGTLGKDLLDTAWRIAVPVILFAVIGLIIDKKFGFAPWLTLTLTAAGFFVAGWLIKKQLTAVEKREEKS